MMYKIPYNLRRIIYKLLIITVVLGLSACDTFKEDLRPTGANRVTVAKSDYYRTTVNTAIVISPLANDSIFSKARIVMAPPAFGAVQNIIDADSFIYQPRANFVGLDSIRYAIYTGSASTEAVVRINVERGTDTCPVTTVPEYLELSAFSSITFNPVLNDINCDPVSLATWTEPKNGSITSVGRNLLKYTPRPGYFGLDTMSYYIRNVYGETAQGKISFTINPNPSCDTTFNPQPDTIYFPANSVVATTIRIFNLLENDRYCQGDINPASFYLLALPQEGTLYRDATNVYFNPDGINTPQIFRYSVSNATGRITRSANVYLVPQ